MNSLIRLLRVNNWIKNLLVLSPLFFSYNIFHIDKVILGLVAFLAFCFISSFIYIFNDAVDLNKDKLHPRKKNRPMASGVVSKKKGLSIAVVLLVAALLLSLYVSFFLFIIILFYGLLNSAYNLILKRIPLVEAFIISFNFLLRIIAGCVAIEVLPTEWIIFITFFLSIMLTFIKRKSELILLQNKSEEHRAVLKFYTLQGVNQIILISATLVLAGYVLYTINHPIFAGEVVNWLFYSFVFVAFGLFRFIQLGDNVEKDGEGDPTVLLLRDKYLQFSLVFWIVYVTWAMYFS